MAIKSKSKAKDRRSKPDVGAKLNSLPNTFKFAAETLKMMSEREGSVASIVVKKYKSYNYKLIFALVMNAAKNIKIIKKIIHEVKLAKKVPENNPFLLEILVGDLLYGRGLKSVEQNSLAAAIIGLKDAIVKQQTALRKSYPADTGVAAAKYLRINHLKTNMDHVLSQLKTVGLTELEYSKSKIKFRKFVNKYKTMSDKEFMRDFHFPNDLIILKPESIGKLRKTDLLMRGRTMFQDKASFMAVEALDVRPTHIVIDACCAPGCKTTVIGDKLKNRGKIMAYDIDRKRLYSATHMLKVHGVTCARTEVQDFSKLKFRRIMNKNDFDSFDSILIDPSCSGSGIHSRVDYKSSSDEIGRLKKLQAFQISLLRHALKARVSKSIVYCTCSISVEENEEVIKKSLAESGVESDWEVVDVLPYWPRRGDSKYEFGSKCLRFTEQDLTNGFFIAKLSRKNETKTKDAEAVGEPDQVGKGSPAAMDEASIGDGESSGEDESNNEDDDEADVEDEDEVEGMDEQEEEESEGSS